MLPSVLKTGFGQVRYEPGPKPTVVPEAGLIEFACIGGSVGSHWTDTRAHAPFPVEPKPFKIVRTTRSVYQVIQRVGG